MIYQRFMRAFLLSIVSIFPAAVGIIIFYYFTEEAVSVLITAGMLTMTFIGMSGYYLFCYYSTKKYDRGNVELNYEKLSRFIIKTDIWFFKRLLVFDVDGRYVGLTKIDISGLKSLFISHLSYYKIIVPLMYKIYDHKGNIVCMFKREGFKSATVNIYNDNNEWIGKIEFDELKTILKFSGTVYVGNTTHRVTSELFFEDVDSGIMKLSSFQNRMEYHYIFRDMYNETATLQSPISVNEGKVGLAVLCMLYYFRWK